MYFNTISKNYNDLLTAVLPKLTAYPNSEREVLNRKWNHARTTWNNLSLPPSVRFNPKYIVWVHENGKFKPKRTFPALLAKITNDNNIPVALYILPLVDGEKAQVRAVASGRGSIRLSSTSRGRPEVCFDLQEGLDLWRQGNRVRVVVS